VTDGGNEGSDDDRKGREGNGREGNGRDGKGRPASNPWLIAIVVTLAAFMELLDTTIVNVSLPHIAGNLSASYDEATWTLTSYLVANSIVLPISAFFGRLIGRKRYFVICIMAFTVCSFLCGIATNLGELVVFRVLQGFFGGGLQPNQQSIILDTFPPAQRGRAFALTAIATVIAPVLGPTVGGWITDNYSWRWVFFINIPIGVIATFAVLSLVEDPPWAKAQSRVSTDYVGIGLIALTFAAFQIMLDRGEDDDWFSSPFIGSLAVIAAVAAATAVAWLLYARKPVVDLRVFKDRNFALGCIAIGCFAMLLYGSAVLVPQLAQQHLGYTALLAGLLLSPGALCVIFLIPLLNLVLPRVQTRFVVTFGFLVLGSSMLYSRTLTPDIDFTHLMSMRITQSLGIGFLFVPLSILTYGTLPRKLQGDATALFTMFRNVFGSVGISVSTAMVTSRTQTHMAYLGYHSSHANPNFQEVLSQLTRAIEGLGSTASVATQKAFGQAYQTLIAQAGFLAYKDVFLYCALLAFAFAPMTFLFSGVKKAGGAAPGAH
jgi:MFS transporter, DHA2 family, multidrug resistance protein